MPQTLHSLPIRGGYTVQRFDNLSAMQRGLMQLDTATSKPVFVESKQDEGYQAVWNADKNKRCMITSSKYTLVQHREVFDSFLESMKELGLNASGTIWNNGNRVIAEVQFKGKGIEDPSAGHIRGDDTKNGKTIQFGVLLRNSYDKSMAIVGNFYAGRLACLNGMVIGRQILAVHQKHIGRINILERMKTFLTRVLDSEEKLQKLVSDAIAQTMEWQIAYKVLEKLFSQPRHREEILKRLGISMVSVEDKKTKKVTVSYIWDKPQEETKKVSRWQLYNAVTNYLTHGERMTPHVQEVLQGKASKLLEPTRQLERLIEVKVEA